MQSSGDVTCSSTSEGGARNYVVTVQHFGPNDAGDYICTVVTEWYKTESSRAITRSARDQLTLSLGSANLFLQLSVVLHVIFLNLNVLCDVKRENWCKGVTES